MHLSDPLGPRSLRRVVRDLGGVHAQVTSAGELQCAVRALGLRPGAIDDALWKKRSLVKTWAMRGTLHFIDADDFPVWAAALSTHRAWRRPVWLRTFNLTEADVEAAVDAVGEVLDGRCLTRATIADEVHERLGNPVIDEFLRSGWGSILKIVATYGLLCFGPAEGRNVTFTRPDQWLSGWARIPTEDAIAEVCRRYLSVHAPATREEFARWWGFSPPDARKVLEGLGDEVVEVDREGAKAYVLGRDQKSVLRASEDREVRLLGMFDPYTLAGLPHEEVVEKKNKDLVYRKGAWVSQVVLRGGRVAGVWTHDRKGGIGSRKGVSVEVTSFGGRIPKRAIERALEPLEPYFGKVSTLRVA